MLLQRAIIFRAKRLKPDHLFETEHPLDEYFFHFNIGAEKFAINTVHIKSPQPKGMIFFLHGTLNHIQYHLPKATVFIENNYDVVMMDYPTYGKSTGKLTEDLLHAVVEETYRQTLEKFGQPERVYFIGRSLGTALASRLATVFSPDGLVLISPYYSMPDLFRHKAAKVIPFKRLKFKLENHTYLPQVTCPAYIIHGTEDRLIPISLAQKLIPFLPSEEHFITVPEADHFNVHKKAMYLDWIQQLLR